jgi:predicted phage terminase large subunit-like protein
METTGISPAALKKAQELAYRQIAERCKVDLFYLNKWILNCDIEDEFVHGYLCRATRPLLYWKDKAYAAKFEFPSDWGRTEEEGLPNEQEKLEFYEKLRQFIPGDIDEKTGRSELDVDFNPNLHQLLALVPRGTLKTTVVTIGFVLQWFLVYPESRVLIDSETSTNSTGFLGEIKGHLEGNDAYREVFKACHGVYPDAYSNNKQWRWSNSQVDLGCRTKQRKEASIDTGGVDTTKNSRHYDLIVFDDLHSEINTQTKEQIEKVKNHWKLAFSLLDPGCPVIVIGTRWTFDDLYQMIIDEHKSKYNIIARKAIGDDGDLLYPAKLDQEFLDGKRELQGGYIFSCQYMNDPVDSENAKFRRDWFQYRTWDQVDGIPINWYLTVDPGGDGANSDYAALVVSGMDYQENLYVRYIVRAKMTEGQIAKMTINLYRKFMPKRIAVETLAGAGKGIITAYKTLMKELGIWLPIQYIEHRVTAKTTRIEALAPKYEFGHVFHIKESPNIKFLEDELTKFPKAKNDDVSDAFATVLEIATPPMKNQVQRNLDNERKKRFKKLNAPRSTMIGY